MHRPNIFNNRLNIKMLYLLGINLIILSLCLKMVYRFFFHFNDSFFFQKLKKSKELGAVNFLFRY